MARVVKRFEFEAAHQLPNHIGKCARLHGHSYKLEVCIDGPITNDKGQTDDGFVVDFGDLSAFVKPAIEQWWDHHFLNDTIDVSRTTAELLACWWVAFVEDRLRIVVRHPRPVPIVKYVRIWETESSSAVAEWSDWDANRHRVQIPEFGATGWEVRFLEQQNGAALQAGKVSG
jgi:6-pyruvoyltetrahydropterin/6-carboxytetrahydropterin synthase